MRCDECRNSGICKFEDNTRKFETDIKKAYDPANESHLDKPEVIDVNIFCHKYLRRFYKQDGFNPKSKNLS